MVPIGFIANFHMIQVIDFFKNAGGQLSAESIIDGRISGRVLNEIEKMSDPEKKKITFDIQDIKKKSKRNG